MVQLSQELKVHLFLCFELLVRFYDLIDKRKPTAGVGCLEFPMLHHNEKLKLVIEYLNAGVVDVDMIIHNINKLEKSLFSGKD